MDKEILVGNGVMMPVLPLKGLVLFPGNLFHFDVARKRSILAVNACVRKDQKIFLVPQLDLEVEVPGKNDMCPVGTVAVVKQVLKQTTNEARVMVEGLYRATVQKWVQTEPFLMANVRECVEYVDGESIRLDALMRQVKLTFFEYNEIITAISPNVVVGVRAERDPGKLADLIASNITFEYEDAQEILCELNVYDRIDMIFHLMVRELLIARTEADIRSKVKHNIDEDQKAYYLREQIKVISEELGDANIQDEANEFREEIEELDLSDEVREKLLKECDTLFKMPSGSHEANVWRNHLDMCIHLPWNSSSKININLKKARKVLDDDHYGLEKVKERIIETLAVKKLAPDIKGQILCLVGPPGVGKTSVAKSVAKAIGCEYTRIALGGIRDEAEIRGHRRTYIGSMPGRIISAINKTGVNNPLVLLDEIDKISNDFRGDPTAALLEVLDSEQNYSFEDHYIDLPFDLSNVFFITTANDYGSIPEPLLDRMDVIELSSYTAEEKFNIAKKHLLPKQMKKHGIKAKNFRITDGALKYIIDKYTREAGVRNLERMLAKILRKTAQKIVDGEEGKTVVDIKTVPMFLGSEKFKDDALDKKDQVGLVNGLAWTSVGGQMLQIEVAVMPGNGKLELTGSLGDVMKESARAALSCVRTRAKKLNIKEDFYKKYDIHIHVPEGAVPKDGPSAGITLATALVSALNGEKVRHDVAMTGEITLRGRVMPIGGLKEKSMAAYKNKIKTVLIPIGNVSDLEEVDTKVKENIEFIPVSDFDEVVDIALNTKKIAKIKKNINKDKLSQIKNIPPKTEATDTVYA